MLKLLNYLHTSKTFFYSFHYYIVLYSLYKGTTRQMLKFTFFFAFLLVY